MELIAKVTGTGVTRFKSGNTRRPDGQVGMRYIASRVVESIQSVGAEVQNGRAMTEMTITTISSVGTSFISR